jgi:peroxiredoxin
MRKEIAEQARGIAMGGVDIGSRAVGQVGEKAPDFDLPVLLSGVKGRLRLFDKLNQGRIVLAFYPGNWDEVSARQITEYQEARARFESQNAQVVGISVDSIMNTTSWERVIGPIDVPLCSDFWPHGAVSASYGTLRREGSEQGHCERAIVVVDQKGTIVYRKTYPDVQKPPLADTWEALRAA